MRIKNAIIFQWMQLLKKIIHAKRTAVLSVVIFIWILVTLVACDNAKENPISNATGNTNSNINSDMKGGSVQGVRKSDVSSISSTLPVPVKKGVISKSDYERLKILKTQEAVKWLDWFQRTNSNKSRDKYLNNNIFNKEKGFQFPSDPLGNDFIVLVEGTGSGSDYANYTSEGPVNSSWHLVVNSIRRSGGKIIYQDSRIGYLHFSSSAALVWKMLSDGVLQSLMLDQQTLFYPYTAKDEDIKEMTRSSLSYHLATAATATNGSNLNRVSPDVYPVHMMKADELIKEFKAEYGKDLNGSNATIAVFDTGLDIARTDVFQDRIVGLRSIRPNDSAVITEAVEEVINGKKYLTANILEQKIIIERTKRLQPQRTYYLGYLSEKRFGGNNEYNNYDLNQDGKDTAIYPIVVFKNEEGHFEAYINVNDAGIYGEKLGDHSIEDENKLLDFNWVAQNIKASERFVFNNRNPIKSYYRYTTRMDIAVPEDITSIASSSASEYSPGASTGGSATGSGPAGSNSNEWEGYKLVTDRTKGAMNVAITIEPGWELTEDGSALKVVQKAASTDGVIHNYYKIGITGIDINGHGTFCAAIAAGDNYVAPDFNSATNQAKIVGVSFLGSSRDSDFFDAVLRTIKSYPNVVFSFSFGSSDRVNDTGSPQAKLFDTIARAYSVPFIKSAGNEGPGVKSVGTTVANSIISVANYYSSDSRKTSGSGSFNSGSFIDHKFYLSTSSSHGPTIDGALKPDIGAPGWVLAAPPLGRPLGEGEHQRSFQYWAGTSMAAPNVASVVALLYDAAIKSGRAPKSEVTDWTTAKAELNARINTLSAESLDGSIPLAPISLDKIVLALKNSALPYDEINYARRERSELLSKRYQVGFDEGGAGRVNALGAWEVIKQIWNEPINYYVTETASLINGFDKPKAVGFFSINYVPSSIEMGVRFANYKDGDNLPITSLSKRERFLLQIPGDIDWLSFDLASDQKERYIDVFGGELTTLRIYVKTEKLVQNGRVLPGKHIALVKAFNVKHLPLYDFIFPVTILGYDTTFNPYLDKSHLESSGFIPSGHFQSYLLPVQKDGDSLLLDLDVSGENPGKILMYLYGMGQKLSAEDLHVTSRWAVSSAELGEGREHLKFVASNLRSGLYEVTLIADDDSREKWNNIPGSYYSLRASRLSLTVGDLKLNSDSTSSKVILSNVINNDSLLRIDHARVQVDSLREQKPVTIKELEKLEYPIVIPEGIKEIEITTKYSGAVEGIDVDISLRDENGKVLESSSGPTADERIISGVKPGKYTLRIEGYSIPTTDKSVTIALTVKQVLSTPVVLADSFKGRGGSELVVTKGFAWGPGRSYELLQASFANDSVDKKVFKLSGYSPVVSVDIAAIHNNSGDFVTIYKKDLN